MSARTGLTIVGQAVGSIFGPVGSAIGGMIGNAIGGAIDGPQRFDGNRLQDLRAPKLQYGAKWPRPYGRFRTAGIVLWQSDLEEVATETEQGGKGGPTAVSTNYTYYRSVLYGFADGTRMDAIARIWRNGKLIYSVLADSDGATIDASLASEHFDSVTFYKGLPDQLPDPIYEAAVGAENAIGWRNRSTGMLARINCGNSDQTGLFEFEVMEATGTASLAGDFRSASQGTGYLPTLPDGVVAGDALLLIALSDSAANDITTPAGYTRINSRFTSASIAPLAVFKRLADGTEDDAAGFTSAGSTGAAWMLVAISGPSADFPADEPGLAFEIEGDPDGPSSNGLTNVNGTTSNVVLTGIWYVAPEAGGATIDSIPPGYTDIGTETFAFNPSPNPGLTTGMRFARKTVSSASENPGAFTDGTGAYGVGGSNCVTVMIGLSDSSGITPKQVDLADILIAEHSRANDGITAEFDYEACRGIPVDSFVAAGSAREGMEFLRTAYYLDCYCTDKVYSVLRGGDSVATIPWASTGVGKDQAGAPFVGPARDNNAEVAQKVALSYTNLDADYDAGSETGDRLTGISNKIDQIQLPIGFHPSKAKGIAETIAADGRTASMGAKVTLDDEFARLQPTDVVTWTDEDGNTFRMRIAEQNYADGVNEYSVVLDDVNDLIEVGITSATYSQAVTVEALPDTELLLIDGPIGRDVDNDAGIYALMKPATGFNWRTGAVLFESQDGATFTKVAAVTSPATFGTTTTALGAWTGARVFDEEHSVTVDIGDGTLSSSTRTAILNDASINACAIGADGRWEYLQFRDATLVSVGVYTLTGLLRGSRGTEHQTAAHAVGDSFALFTVAGTLRVARTTPQLGVTYTYKGVTSGRNLSTGDEETLSDDGVGLLPFSPFDVRKAVDVGTGDITLTWQRRSRLAVRTTGALGISIPLGEQSESYLIDIFSDGTFATVLRTLTATTTSVAYTSAMQSSDTYSAGDPLYVRVYQLSAVVGRGTKAEATV